MRHEITITVMLSSNVANNVDTIANVANNVERIMMILDTTNNAQAHEAASDE